MNPYPSVL